VNGGTGHLVLEHVLVYASLVALAGIVVGAGVMAFIHEMAARTRIARRAAYEQSAHNRRIIKALNRIAG